MSNLSRIIRELRGSESLRKASKRIGISHVYLDTLEKGYDKRSKAKSKPTPNTLKLISDAYNFDYEILLLEAGYASYTDKNLITDFELEVIQELRNHKELLNFIRVDVGKSIDFFRINNFKYE